MDEQKTRFFANISHELRTPLTLILAPVEQQLAATAEPALRRDLELVRSNARILERRVTDLLELARSGVGEAHLSLSPLDVAALLHATTDPFRPLVEERSIELQVDAPPELPLETDRNKVERVVDNLVTNAFKFTAEGGAIRLTARTTGPAEDADLLIQVADSGPGIAPEDRERVFDRFHQLGSSGISGMGGSGLGLAIVRDFVHLLGGTVDVDEASDLGGALFTVRIPTRAPAVPAGGRASVAYAAPSEQPGAAAPRLEEAPTWEEAVDSGSSADSSDEGRVAEGAAFEVGPVEAAGALRVLVVEDVPDLGRFLHQALSENYQVRLVGGGEEALGLIDDWIPDLVVTDLMMSGIDGETLVRTLRQRPELRDIPILVLSARADEEMRARLLQSGAQDYVTKPFAIAELQARVRNLVAVKRVRDLLQSQLEDATGDARSLAGAAGAPQ